MKNIGGEGVVASLLGKGGGIEVRVVVMISSGVST